MNKAQNDFYKKINKTNSKEKKLIVLDKCNGVYREKKKSDCLDIVND